MATEIQWTDETWNPVTGCTKVSPGCAHCYAEGVANRFFAKQYPAVLSEGCAIKTRPRVFTDVQCHPERLDQPLRWKKPRKVFVNSMSDLFQEDVPDEFIDQVFAVMAMARPHTFQVLTKRAGRMLEYFDKLGFEPERIDDAAGTFGACHANLGGRWPLPNVWLGVSVENQHFADERIPLLLQTTAAVRFISAEPLLGPVDLNIACAKSGLWMPDGRPTRHRGVWIGLASQFLDWVIVGGESGPKSRSFDVAWARSLVKQCRASHVPVFMKQLGGNPWVQTKHHYGPGVDAHPYNVRYQLKDKKGGEMAEWPTDLRVREFPSSVERATARG